MHNTTGLLRGENSGKVCLLPRPGSPVFCAPPSWDWPFPNGLKPPT